MRYFQKIVDNIDTLTATQQLLRNPQLWDADRFRTSYPGTPHTDVSDVILRFSDTSTSRMDSEVIGDSGIIWHPSSEILSAVKPLVLGIMRIVDGYELGRVIITRVRPGGVIRPHADDKGDYVQEFSRYHIVLQGLPGSLYHCGNETVNMQTGSCWWFQHLEVHSIENNSADDRIHILADYKIWP